MSKFRDDPFLLQVGDPIVGIVTATNGKGESDPSAQNSSGASVQNVPSAAPTLSRGEQTNSSQIELTWATITDSIDIGGSPITGFKVYWDSGDDLGNFNLFYTSNDPNEDAYITTAVS